MRKGIWLGRNKGEIQDRVLGSKDWLMIQNQNFKVGRKLNQYAANREGPVTSNSKSITEQWYHVNFHCSSPCLFLKAIKTTQGLVDQTVSILKGRENRLGFASSLVHRSKIPRTTGHQRNAMCFNTFAS